MSKHYKVWIEIEEIDEDKNLYDVLPELETPALGDFDTLKEARELVRKVLHFNDQNFLTEPRGY